MRFGHSGKLGDLIYHLGAIRQMGGGDVRMFWRDECGIGPAEAEPVLPLLRAQPYVGSAGWHQTWEGPGLNLDRWRDHIDLKLNLADMLADWLGLPHWPREEPWLEVPSPRRVAPVVFARARHRHNPAFPWKRVWDLYHDRAVFLGLPEEHAAFGREVGRVRHEPTADLLAAARVIAGCDLFVGNQSSLHAVAEGLKRPLVLEAPVNNDFTTHYHRRHAWYVRGPEDYLPRGYGRPPRHEHRVISFALWGDDPMYTLGAIENVAEAARVYPGWVCRFHVAADCPALPALRDLPCQVVEMPPLPRDADGRPCRSGLFWRFLPLEDPAVDRVIFRDTDSRVSEREANAVEEWAAYGCRVHAMHDCGAHSRHFQTGMWGAVRGAVPDIVGRAERWRRAHLPGHLGRESYADERFLSEVVWPEVKAEVLFHGHWGRPFPPHPPLRHGSFVGDIVPAPEATP